MGLEIKKASRKDFVPLIALYSESGCGKTYSALLMARGLAGPTGRIIMIDTESGRGELYADVPIIGGYDVISMEEPYNPARYIEAVREMQKANAIVGIVDSGSHEWEGIGGVLDMGAENEIKSGKSGLHNWKKPKFEHAKFIQSLIKAKIPLIVCLRAKFKTRQARNNGKTVIVKDDHTSPIQAEDFIFEATCHGEIMTDHKLRLTKWSHPTLKECFPVNGPITIKTGELIAQWCASPGTNAIEPSTPPIDDTPIDKPETKNESTGLTIEEKLSQTENIGQIKTVWKEINDAFEAGIITDTDYRELKKIKNTKKKQFETANK